MPFLLVALSTSWMVQASDLDIVSDSVVPENSIPDVDLFTFTGIRGITLNPLSFLFLLILENPAISISSFRRANAGTVSVPASVFANGIDGVVLAKAFKTDVPATQKIKAGLAAKA
ncbi:hypothetical protein Peur_074436 [Populus x canadensis]